MTVPTRLLLCLAVLAASGPMAGAANATSAVGLVGETTLVMFDTETRAVSGTMAVSGVEGLAGIKTESACVRATTTGLVAEFSLPLPAGEKSFHLNLGWQDHDRPENTKPSVLWWRDAAVAEFGEFVLP